VTEPARESSHWVAANANARLDRPVSPGERHRFAKRVVAGVCRPFFRRQTAYNLELLAELVTIRDSLVAQTKALGASTTDQFAALVTQVAVLVTQVDVLACRVDELHVLLGVTNARLDEAMVDRDLVHQEVELARRQALDGIAEAVGGIRRELGLVARCVGGRENEPTRPRGRVPQS
jgi:hypothetical protein